MIYELSSDLHLTGFQHPGEINIVSNYAIQHIFVFGGVLIRPGEEPETLSF